MFHSHLAISLYSAFWFRWEKKTQNYICLTRFPPLLSKFIIWQSVVYKWKSHSPKTDFRFHSISSRKNRRKKVSEKERNAPRYRNCCWTKCRYTFLSSLWIFPKWFMVGVPFPCFMCARNLCVDCRKRCKVDEEQNAKSIFENTETN